jgi:hypothetical protein
LMMRGQRQIVRGVQIFQHLLGYAMKHRRCHLAALMKPAKDPTYFVLE